MGNDQGELVKLTLASTKDFQLFPLFKLLIWHENGWRYGEKSSGEKRDLRN